jgi:hypothetical protein
LARNVSDHTIEILAATLCRLLGEAEEWDEKTKSTQGAKPKPIKRKWRKKTPPEELRSSDEEKYKEDERQVRKKSDKLDGSYDEDIALVGESSQSSV